MATVFPIMYLVTQERCIKVLGAFPYTPKGFRDASTMAIVSAQTDLGPIILERQLSDMSVVRVVRMEGGN